MPIVKRTGKQTAPSFGGGGALPSNVLRYAAQKKGALTQRAGASIAALGEEFAELALRMENTKTREEFEDAKLTYDEGMLPFLAEQENNPDLGTWGDATAQKHDTLSAEVGNNIRSTKAKGQFSDWARANRSILMFKTVTRADRMQADKARSMVKMRMENYTRRGDIGGFKIYLREMEEDGLLIEDEVEFWDAEIDEFAQRLAYKEALEIVETEALSILSTSTVEAAISFVREAITAPELSGADKRSLVNLVEFFDRINQYEDRRVKLEAKRAEISEFTTQLAEGTLDPRRIETSDHGVSHQKQWKDYLKNSMREEPEVDWRKYLDLEDRLFDHWNVDKTEYELAVVESRYGDNAIINNREFGALLKRIQLDMPRQYMVSLKTGFETISRAGAKWKFGIFRKLNQEEAQRVAQARSALFDWLLEDRISKKKETSPEEFYTRAKELAVLFQPGRKIERTPTIKRSDAFEGLSRYLDTVKVDSPADLMTDLRNAVKAVREGRDINLVFGRILEVYKDRKKVQDFLETTIRPIITEDK